MELGQIVAAGLLLALALAHSVAGETGFIRPLLAASWTIEEVPRSAANRLLRVAWHLTSVAWVALAVIVIGGGPVVAASMASLVSGVMMLGWLPAHPAWPAFLVAGLFGLQAEGLLTRPVLLAASAAAVAVLVGLAALHVYWVAGGRWLLDGVIPTTAGRSTSAFRPPPVLTLAVAALLTTLAALIALAAATDQAPIVTVAVLGGAAVLGARAVGDGRYAGFTKQERTTIFGQRDDRWYTPLCVLAALSATASVLL